MEGDVLSDVHTFSHFEEIPEANCSVSRFEFKVKRPVKIRETSQKHSLPTEGTEHEKVCKRRKISATSNAEPVNVSGEMGISISDILESDTIHKDIEINKKVAVDNDGDFVGRRDKPQENNDIDIPKTTQVHEIGYVNIKHHLATNLERVGEQVWLGSLLLCDYIIDQCEEFSGQTVVDLGSGTGLTSIVAALYANKVFCTDTGESVLALAQENTETARLYPSLPWSICPLDVCDLNWFVGLKEPDESISKLFDLKKEDIDSIQRSKVIIAADVVYDDNITDAFFQTVWELLDQKTDKVMYIGLEKRLVFTLDDLDVASPAYQHFRRGFDDLQVKGETNGVNIHVKQIATDFVQHCFKYTRTKQLELWKVWTERGVT